MLTTLQRTDLEELHGRLLYRIAQTPIDSERFADLKLFSYLIEILFEENN